MTTVISKATIMRLLKDVKSLVASPLCDNGIYYIHDEDDMLKGWAMIVGPEDTPYFGGFYFFEIQYPTDYPYSPPTVIYKTQGDAVRFNPNLYMNGKVCLSILNTWKGEQWTSCQTISTVLLNLCMVLCKDPLLNEPGITTKYFEFDNYTKSIEYKNIEIAMLKMLDTPPEKFVIFRKTMEEHFSKNIPKTLKMLEERKREPPSRVVTGIYKMDVYINYEKLHARFINKIELNNK